MEQWTVWLPWLGGALAAIVAFALALRWFARDPRALTWLLAGQAVLILTVLCVPFGFDHPSAWGLDFGHFLTVLALYALILVGGIVVGSKLERWPLVALQVATPCAVFLLGALGILHI